MSFQEFAQFLRPYTHSPAFLVIKMFLAVYSLILIYDIVLIAMLRGTGKDFRMVFRGMNIPAPSSGRMTKRWLKIKNRLESENLSQYKVAILEADKVADEILVYMGYKGTNMTERLDEAKVEQLEDKEALIQAHKIRNQIIHQPDFSVSKELADETIAIYEKFLHHFEFI